MKGQPCVDARRPATNAPKPAMANCASESWPVYPVSTTTDSSRMAKQMVTTYASTHTLGDDRSRAPTMATVVTNRLHRMRPLPIEGSFCSR
ncbi:unannotated protein [freshwater metagenome]|uniref:Unannotated protein n=1 Tax=freshwater metagenome TaxID=449393 RepID=A0A6J7Q808_9ZZZZ